MLEGVRILDLSRVIAGSFCSRMLGDLGAEVIKVEPPTGDAFRRGEPQKHGFSALFSQFNVGKKSVCINLRDPGGIALVHELAATADVFLENFRAGLAAEIGIDHAAIRQTNPGIVYCSVSGFGQHGDGAGRPAYTDIIQALSGLDYAASQMFGNASGAPPGFPASLADVCTAQYAAIAILAALFRRQQTGGGEHIDMSMLDAMISVNDTTLQRYLFSNGEIDGPSPIFRPPLKLTDGFVSASIGLNVEKTLRAIGRPELIDDPLFATSAQQRANMAVYVDIVSAWAADRTVAEVTTLFAEHDIPYGKVRSTAEVLAADTTRDRELLAEVEVAGGSLTVVNTPFNFASGKSRPSGPPPRLGEHTREVLTRLLGKTAAVVDQLVFDGIVAVDPEGT
ncbi:MAG: CaiB/BaiF CoA transferase family protein [Pseudomonadales bacterium]